MMAFRFVLVGILWAQICLKIVNYRKIGNFHDAGISGEISGAKRSSSSISLTTIRYDQQHATVRDDNIMAVDTS